MLKTLCEMRFMTTGFGIMKMESVDLEKKEFTAKVIYSMECEILKELKKSLGHG